MEALIEAFSTPQAWAQLVTLVFLEIVLGIDNIVFISITSDRLPKNKQHIGRRLGLALALFGRVALLLSLTWVMRLTHPLFTVGPVEVTGKGLILLLGGLYLVYKGVVEIRDMLLLTEERERHGHPDHKPRPPLGLAQALVTIFAMDIVFSLDSVITAVGLSGIIPIMIIAITIAILFMMIFADVVSDFINNNPEIKLLALIFILTVGILLVTEFFGIEIPHFTVYFAMFFSLVVTLFQMRYANNLKKMHEEIADHHEELASGDPEAIAREEAKQKALEEHANLLESLANEDSSKDAAGKDSDK